MAQTDSKTHLNALPTFSVVIPAYNEERVIKACLEALYAQADNIERVIVVDNNSSDATARVARGVAAKWPAVRVVSELSPGVVSARNTGLNAADSDIIARIDADTLVQPGWAHAYRAFFADSRHADVGGSTGIAVPYDMPLPRLTEAVYNLFIIHSNRLIASGDTLFGTNMAIRRSAWLAISRSTCRRANIMEDLDIGLHLQKSGYRVQAITTAKVKFSARRLLSNPWHYVQYSSMWPATYWHHGMWLTAVLAWPFMVMGCGLQLTAWPLLRSYNPATRRFSLRRLFSRMTTRDIPKGS